MCYRVKVPEMNVKIGVWCPNETVTKNLWDLKRLKIQGDTRENGELVKGLRDAMKKMCVRDACAPHVAPANAQVIDARMLKRRIYLGGGRFLHRNCSIPADGIFLKKGRAFIMSTAGCPIIIATAGEHMIVAHAGRDSLIDRGAVDGAPTRGNLSIVYTIVGELIKQGAVPNEIKMCMLFSIPTKVFEHRFDHYLYGEQNRSLAAFIGIWCPEGVIRENGSMFLDLENIFLKQTYIIGIDKKNAWAAHSLSQYPAMAHTRDGKDPTRRNLLVVKRL